MKAEVEKSIREHRVIAIMRGLEPEICVRLAEAYLKGGIHAVEVTYVQTDRSLWKNTTTAIETISRNFGNDLFVGAGTVLTAEQLSMTRDAGGTFMVAPNVNPELVRECASYDMAPIPGAVTPTEAVTAWEAGASFVKMFPAGSLGPGYVKAVMTPLKHIPFLAVGGVVVNNAADFIKAGCVGVAVSGALTDKDMIAAGKWDEIAAVARQFVERTHQ